MSINNKITGKRIKKALTLKTVAIVLVIVAIATVVFYTSVKNRDRKELLIWHITAEAENYFTDEQLSLINKYGAENGIEKIVITKRHPEDRYFDATMSTTAYYNCDVFIMSAEMAENYVEMDMFMILSYDGENDLLYYGEKAIGILIYDNYYLLINQKTDIDLQVIYDIYDILTRK